MKKSKRKKAIAAAFTVLVAFSSISSGAGIPVTETETGEDQSLYLQLESMIEKYNPGLDALIRKQIFDSALQAADTYQVPLPLILAVMGCESEFRPALRGALDEAGLMQIRMRYAPSWARAMGITPPQNKEELADIPTNIHMGTFILSYLLNKYQGDIHKTLVAYNAGEGYVARKIGRNESLPTAYLNRVERFYKELLSEEENRRIGDSPLSGEILGTE